MKHARFARVCRHALVAGAVLLPAAHAQDAEQLRTLEVIGTTPTHGVGLPRDRVPYKVDTAGSADLERSQSLDLTDYLNRSLGSVNTNAAQNNPLQPDVQFRGFTASPLLGLPQGLAIYTNGVRVNEVFGDEVNWDLIPESAIGSINLIAGANPLFGLNTLGGALSIQTKNGFTHPGKHLEVYGGSFDRVVSTVELGDNNGTVGYYLNVSHFDESGWRDFSDSNAFNLFASLGYRSESTTADLHVSRGDTELRGNGATPVELLRVDREAVFTHPDLTENESFTITGEASHWLTNAIMLSGNAYYRDLATTAFNGDGGEFEECDPPFAGFLCEDDEPDEPIFDQFGNLIPEDLEGAINNLSTRQQNRYGYSAQSTFLQDLFGRGNQFIVGVAFSRGEVAFDSVVEAAELNPDRSTTRTGVFVDGEGTRMEARSRSASVYLTDTLNVTDQLALTVSGRFNSTHVDLFDRSGEDPDLNGKHHYDRFNPAAGVTYAWRPDVTLFGSYSESNRAPTPVELACAREDAPCRLPNAFLADPPLEQVVAKSWEGGLRGAVSPAGLGTVQWSVGGFHTLNEDDIIFQSTGGATANQGFFDNVGDTRRLGAELGLQGRRDRLQWFLNYSYVEATFRDDFFVFSPNNPLAVDDQLRVSSGDRIPGIPEHILKVGADYEVINGLTVGADVIYNSDQYLRGDEANVLDTIDGYAVMNLRGNYRVNKHVSVFARIDNLFDTDYETFGLLGEPDEVLGDAFQNPRFFGAGSPRAGWVGVRLSM